MKLLELKRAHWYGWQMMPGYSDGAPYFSPIFVRRVEPLKTGRSLLMVHFFNAGYAEGAREFAIEMRIASRKETFLFAHDANIDERCPWVEIPGATEGTLQTDLTAAFGVAK